MFFLHRRSSHHLKSLLLLHAHAATQVWAPNIGGWTWGSCIKGHFQGASKGRRGMGVGKRPSGWEVGALLRLLLKQAVRAASTTSCHWCQSRSSSAAQADTLSLPAFTPCSLCCCSLCHSLCCSLSCLLRRRMPELHPSHPILTPDPVLLLVSSHAIPSPGHGSGRGARRAQDRRLWAREDLPGAAPASGGQRGELQRRRGESSAQ